MFRGLSLFLGAPEQELTEATLDETLWVTRKKNLKLPSMKTSILVSIATHTNLMVKWKIFTKLLNSPQGKLVKIVSYGLYRLLAQWHFQFDLDWWWFQRFICLLCSWRWICKFYSTFLELWAVLGHRWRQYFKISKKELKKCTKKALGSIIELTKDADLDKVSFDKMLSLKIGLT